MLMHQYRSTPTCMIEMAVVLLAGRKEQLVSSASPIGDRAVAKKAKSRELRQSRKLLVKAAIWLRCRFLPDVAGASILEPQWQQANI